MEQYLLNNLYKEGRYEEAAAYWSVPETAEQFNENDYCACMNSLYKLKRYEDCLELYRACREHYPNCDLLDDKMGFALYHSRIKNFDFRHGDVSKLLKQIDFIFAHSSETIYSPRLRIARFIVDAVSDGNLITDNGNELIERYLSQIDPEKLSTEEKEYVDKNGIKRRSASDQEWWYSTRSKALLKLKRYDECLDCCSKGLANVPVFHYNNDSWFRYRIAQCLQAAGKREEATAQIRQIIRNGFAHWCLQEMLFELTRDAGDTEAALMHAGTCALSDPEHKMRVTFYTNLADYLDALGKADEAMLHRQLVILLRKENEWGQKANQANWRISDAVSAMDKPAVLRQLKPFWTAIRDAGKHFLTGTVKMLLPNGKAGFITGKDGSDYYFSVRDFAGPRSTLTAGASVRFALEERLNHKKGTIEKNAVQISLMSR